MVSNMTLSQNMVEEEIGDAGPLSLGDFVSWKEELTELLTMPSKNERVRFFSNSLQLLLTPPLHFCLLP